MRPLDGASYAVALPNLKRWRRWCTACNAIFAFEENVPSSNLFSTSGSLRSECNITKAGVIFGRRNEFTTNNLFLCCARIEGLIRADRGINVREIAYELNIFIGNILAIVHKNLAYWKTCSRWVPRQLSDDNKTTCMRFSLSFIAISNRCSYSIPIVTRNEIRVHHVTPKTKKTLMSWRYPPPLRK